MFWTKHKNFVSHEHVVVVFGFVTNMQHAPPFYDSDTALIIQYSFVIIAG